MEAINSRHHRYLTESTCGLTVLRIVDNKFIDNPLPLIQKLVTVYSQEVLESSTNYETFDVFYKILCYEYQLKFKSEQKYKQQSNESYKLSMSKILKYMAKREEGIECNKTPIIIDIIILQIALYSNTDEVMSLFQNLCQINEEIMNFDIYLFEIMDCIAEALYLKPYLYNENKSKENDLTVICFWYLNEITVFLFNMENPQWKFFISTLSKMMMIFDGNLILSHFWEIIYNDNHHNFERKLTMLSSLIDDIIRLSNDNIDSTITYCVKDEFWKFIFNGLTSTVEQQRKQALYIMKQVQKFVSQHHKLSLEKNIIPFVHCQRENQQELLKQTMIKFYLILESLEEKQGHLITPILVHLEELIQVNIDHQKCGNCFDRIWLRCVFQRILQHKTNAIMKLGLLNLMKLHPITFDEAFLVLLVESLNNTNLYDNKNMAKLPEIPNKLIGLFIKAENSKIDLINKFIQTIPKVVWAPIPLYYIFESMKIATAEFKNIKYNTWRENELEVISTIVEKNLHIQSVLMRDETQINICKIFFCCAKHPLDLNILTKTFSVFLFSNAMNYSSVSWKFITDYLKDNIPTENAVGFLCQACDNLCISENNDHIDSKSLAVMIALFYDARKIFISKSCAVQKSLAKVFDLIRDANVRPYADKILSLRVFQLIKSFLNISLEFREKTNTEEEGDFINQLTFPYLDSAQRFILKSLKESSSPNTYKIATIYIETFRAIVAFNRFVYKNYNLLNDIKVFQEEAIQTIDDLNGIVNLRYWYNLQILYIISTCIIDLNINDEKYKNFLLKICQQQLRVDDKSNVQSGGKLISECYEIISQSIKLFFSNHIDFSHVEFDKWLPSLLDIIDLGKEYVISSVIGTLKEWFNRAHCFLPVESDIYELIIDVSWKNIWDTKKNQYFWSSFDQLIGLMLQSNFLNRKNLIPKILKYVRIIVEKSDNIPNLKNVLIKNLRGLKSFELSHFHDELVKCFLHTNIGRSDTRIEMQTYDYLIKQHDFYQYTMSTSKRCGIYIDVLFRAECVLLFLHIMNSEETKYFTDNTVEFLISILVNLKNKRYFNNSNIHRTKHRVMQLLLIIQPLLDEHATVKLCNSICDLLVSESNQPTIRVMQEWLLTKIFIKYPSLCSNIWDLLEIARTKRLGSITSVASIIYHVEKNLPTDKKSNYIQTAIHKLLPSCFSQSFVVRLYCQVVLSKLFDVIQSLDSLSLDYKIIKDAITQSLEYGNLKKNSIKLDEDFYFHTFEPVQDYDLQTIFYDLPRLLNMSSDELISPEIFFKILNVDSTNLTKVFHISIENKRGLLSPIDTPNLLNLNNEIILEEIENIYDNVPCDIQKKIIPWKSMVPIDVDLSSFRQEKLANDVGLIVVATLIDSIPNLGGLARTSEIFCARELVLANLKCTEYKEFQSLSVSSEKWITITEVKPYDLRNYLLEKKSMGWTLVGAEQTANSISLLDTKFNKKTVLLLGNEKSGIPANLIPLMDICVEIPQAGVIRSLNVHVTGAICLWHYCKQHIFLK